MHSIRQRHHIRLWKTEYRSPDGSLQYVGTASFDKGINWLHLTHRIDPAIDVERKTLVEDCQGAGVLSGSSELAFVEPSAGSNFSGDIFFSDGKIAVLVDDIIDTAGTMVQAAEALLSRGAKKVLACATHGVLSGPAIERIRKSSIHQMVLTNTIPLPEDKNLDKITVLSIAPLFAEAISRIHSDHSVSILFR